MFAQNFFTVAIVFAFFLLPLFLSISNMKSKDNSIKNLFSYHWYSPTSQIDCNYGTIKESLHFLIF